MSNAPIEGLALGDPIRPASSARLVSGWAPVPIDALDAVRAAGVTA